MTKEQFQALIAALALLQPQAVDLQEMIDTARAEGFAAGVASVPAAPVSEKIYSQAEMDAKVAEVLAPLNEQVLAMQGQIADLQAKVDGIPQAIAQAVTDFKAQALEKVKAEEAKLEEILA